MDVERSSKAIKRCRRCLLVAVRISHHAHPIFQIALHRLRRTKLRLAIIIISDKPRLASNNTDHPVSEMRSETARHCLKHSIIRSVCRSSPERLRLLPPTQRPRTLQGPDRPTCPSSSESTPRTF